MDSEQNNPDYSFLEGKNTNTKITGLKNRPIIMIIGGCLILILLILMISSIFGGDGAAKYIKTAQMHTELIRIAEVGEDKSTGLKAKNLSTTTRFTLQSYGQNIIAIANKYQKTDKKLLNGGYDEKTDEALTKAEQRSQFDEVYIPLLVVEIKEYQSQLKNVYQSTSSKKDKETYESLYNDLDEIIQSATSADEATEQ